MSEDRGCYQTDESGVLGVFYNRPKKDEAETSRQGRPVFKTVPYVKINVPADPLSLVDRRVKDADKERWPVAWRAFEEGRSGSVSGTPIEEFPLLTTVQVAEMKAVGIRSVEMLAGVKDSGLKRLGADGRKLRERAAQWLQGAPETERELRTKLEEKDRTITSLEARIAKLEAARDAAEKADDKPKSKPRPKLKNRSWNEVAAQ